jgi:starch phosphorylase
MLPRVDPLPDGYETLRALALDLRSNWNHRADSLWSEIDADLWRTTGNAWLVLQSATRVQLVERLQSNAFRARMASLAEARSPARSASIDPIALFSMEFALSEALPLYSGGLGNVAGDYVKAAADTGVPLVGVGLLYQQGYFRQSINAAGEQREHYPFYDTSQLPIEPVYDEEGAWLRVRLPRRGPPVWLRVWRAHAGSVNVYLLDSNHPANTPTDRGITAQLYGGNDEVRLQQELALGVGGHRALRALGITPRVCHLNEGHAAFAALERARDFASTHGVAFDVALTATRAGNVFTTHTPVDSGFDRFETSFVESQLASYAEELGIPVERILDLGRARAGDGEEKFCTAWLATRCSGVVNAVSEKHELVSREIFQVLFDRWPGTDVPISHVTNGVHVPSWDSTESDALWTKACGAERWHDLDEGCSHIATATDEDIWNMRSQSRASLVAFVRETLARQLAAAAVDSALIERASHVFDVDTLTLGLARRFTAYKRPTLLLRDAERLTRILTHTTRPVQIVVAGKAHPRDDDGKALVHSWVEFARRSDNRMHVVFLADYDLRLAERLVQGVDVWINTPRPPWEACGTSGMKTLVNGGLNVSSMDGWWAEAFAPELGWAIEGNGRDDDADATRLYDLLENEIVPAFYDRDASAIPRAWLARVRASMATLTPRYSARRALREYTEKCYAPAAAAFARRSANSAAVARDLVEWQERLAVRWKGLRFGELRVDTHDGRHFFVAPLHLDDIPADDVEVEIYADNPATRIAMRRLEPLPGAHGFFYGADVPAVRSAHDFTPRVIPKHADANIPLELSLVYWA